MQAKSAESCSANYLSFAENGWGADHLCVIPHLKDENIFLMANKVESVAQDRLNSRSFYIGRFKMPNNVFHYVDPREHSSYLSWNPPREVWEILASGALPLFPFLHPRERTPCGYIIYCEMDGFPESAVSDNMGVRLGWKQNLAKGIRGDVKKWSGLYACDCLVDTGGSSLHQIVQAARSQKYETAPSVFLKLSQRLHFVKNLANNMEALKEDLSFPFEENYEEKKVFEAIEHLPREYVLGTCDIRKEGSKKYRIAIRSPEGEKEIVYSRVHTPLEAVVIGAVNMNKGFDCIPKIRGNDIFLPPEEECLAYLERMTERPIDSHLPKTDLENKAVQNYFQAYELMKQASSETEEKSYIEALKRLNLAVHQKPNAAPLYLRRAQVRYLLGKREYAEEDMRNYEELTNSKFPRPDL